MLFAWVDDSGKIHATSNLLLVPGAYRGRVAVFPDLNEADKDSLYVDEFGRIVVREGIVNQVYLSEKVSEIVREATDVILGELAEYGFYSLGDLLVYSFIGDVEAQELLTWYLLFDREIWSFIDDVLSQWTSERIRSFDVKQFISDVRCFVAGLLEQGDITFNFNFPIRLLERRKRSSSLPEYVSKNVMDMPGGSVGGPMYLPYGPYAFQGPYPPMGPYPPTGPYPFQGFYPPQALYPPQAYYYGPYNVSGVGPMESGSIQSSKQEVSQEVVSQEVSNLEQRGAMPNMVGPTFSGMVRKPCCRGNK